MYHNLPTHRPSILAIFARQKAVKACTVFVAETHASILVSLYKQSHLSASFISTASSSANTPKQTVANLQIPVFAPLFSPSKCSLQVIIATLIRLSFPPDSDT
ncbi:uncharacterized protein TrAtP1_003265 [Trichoderma atroviride]|uniref:uncharacterized protein n=1 Tax=Hypocrea atroviridis TaxID=63577 RepID=UPI003320CA7F|nr:hypothetical protein TrAtP1_003265 [Trichoderma atroviride]